MRWLPLAVIWLVACDRVLGLSSLPTSPDSNESSVTGSYRLLTAEDDMGAMPHLHDQAYASDRIHAVVTLADGTIREVAVDADGKFTFATATSGQAYSLAFQTTYASVTYQLDAMQLDLVERIVGYPDRTPVPSSTAIAYAIANRPSSPASEEVATSGLWSRTTVTLDPDPFMVYWANTPMPSGPVGMLDGAHPNALYYLASESVAGSGDPFTRISDAATNTDVVLVPNTTTPVSGTTSPVPATSCARIIDQRTVETSRLDMLVPGFTQYEADWTIQAAPTVEVGTAAPFVIAQQVQTPSMPGSSTDQMIAYGDPFIGYGLLAAMTVSRFQAVFGVTTQLQLPLPADCNSPVQLAAGAIKVATAIAIDGTPLTSNAQDVTIDRSRDATVSWTPSADGAADYYVVILEEPTGGFAFQARTTVVTNSLQAGLDSSLLTTGHRYMLEIQAWLGTPGAAAGDFRNVVFPRGHSTVRTMTFTAR